MKLWEVTIETLQPLSIAQKISNDSNWETTTRIPGSTWRGAFCEAWRQRIGFEAEEFHALSEELLNEAIFQDAFEENAVFTPVHFKKGKNSEQKAAITNLLTPYIEHNYAPEILIETSEGQLQEIYDYNDKLITNSTIGIQISREREATENGQFYTLTSIAEDTTFYTTAHLSEKILKKIAGSKNPPYAVDLYVGKKRFSGYGKVRVTFSEMKKYPDVSKPITSLQQIKTNEALFAISFISPAIIFDEFLQPAPDINWSLHIEPLLPEHLRHLVPLQEETWGYRDIRQGWQQLWNAPKYDEIILTAGTTYFASFPQENVKQVTEALTHIVQKNIGERKTEGFGQIIVAPDEAKIKYQITKKTKLTPPRKAADSFFTDERLQQILKIAQDFYSIDSHKKIPSSQWHALLAEEDNMLHAILDNDNPDAYIQKRLNARVNNIWIAQWFEDKLNYSAKKKDVPVANNPKSFGMLLRSRVQEVLSLLPSTAKEKEQQIAIRYFIEYCIRCTETDKKLKHAKEDVS